MISFVNMFLTYLILAVASIAIIVVAVICGKKLRDAKDRKDLNKAESNNNSVEEE